MLMKTRPRNGSAGGCNVACFGLHLFYRLFGVLCSKEFHVHIYFSSGFAGSAKWFVVGLVLCQTMVVVARTHSLGHSLKDL